jgi:1-acyl-sn-glycerol-3-phosphate acyltransferase
VIAPALAALARAVSGVSARWLCEPMPRQRIYFANHSSHLDFLVVWASLPPPLRERARPVAARDYWQLGRLRRYLAERVFRGVLIDRLGSRRGAVGPVELMLSALDGGDSLILFPEGTRGDGAAVAPFKSGLFHLAAARPVVELLPVGIENLNRVLPKGEAVPVPVISRLTFGAPMALAPGEDKDSFLRRAHEAVTALAGS